LGNEEPSEPGVHDEVVFLFCEFCLVGVDVGVGPFFVHSEVVELVYGEATVYGHLSSEVSHGVDRKVEFFGKEFGYC